MKRLQQTAFVPVDIANGATSRDLREKAAHMMSVDVSRLRLCRPLQDGDDASVEYLCDENMLHDLQITNDAVVWAVLSDKYGNWEQPLVYPFPPMPVVEMKRKA